MSVHPAVRSRLSKSILPSFLSVLMLCAGTSAFGQTAFGEVLRQTLASHPALSSKEADVQSAGADRDAARWSRYPTPSVEATTAPTGSDLPPGALLRIDQPLWAGGRIDGSIKSADSQVDVANAALEEARWALALQAVGSYSEALRQSARDSHAKAAIQEHQKLLEMIQRRVDQEVSSMVDQRFAESRLLQANNDRSQSAQSLRNALTQLSQLSGTVVKAPVWEGFGATGVPSSLEEAKECALTASPTLRKLQYQIETAEANIDVKRSAYMPQVLFRLERQAGSNFTADSRAMMVLQAQPGAGFAAVNGVASAVAKKDSALMARESAIRDVLQKVVIDWDDYVSSRARLLDATQASEISSDVFDSYARQYVIGRKSWIDVLNAVRETVQAQYALDDAKAQAAAAAVRLQLQCGRLMVPD